MQDNLEWNKVVKNENVEEGEKTLNETKPENSKNNLFKNKKVLFIALGSLVLILIVSFVLKFYLTNKKDSGSDEGNTVSEPLGENNNGSSGEPEEGTGISEVNPPLLHESTSDGGLKNNITPAFTINGPVINNTGNGYVWYSYNIGLSEAASIKYGSGFEYVLGPGNCTDRAFFSSDSDLLSGSLDNPSLGDNTIIVKVENIFLASSYKDSTYEIKDKEGNVIGEGGVLIPDCKSVIESLEKSGSFKVDGPVVTDSNEHVGYSTVKYQFIPDEDALKRLEKGFSFKIYDDGCKDWLSEDPFNKTYEEGKVGYIGTTFELDNDAFDASSSLRRSVYEITDSEGALLFRGFVDVPNCR